MRTDREILVETKILECLKNAGSYMVQETHLYDEVRLAVPRLGRVEFDAVLAHTASMGRALSIEGERGRQWKLTAAGQAWLMENTF